MAGDPILSAGDAALAAQRAVERVQAAEARAPRLVQPIAYPLFPYGGASAPGSDWYIPVTGAAFGVQATTPWIFQPDVLAHQGIILQVPWRTGAGTTGEMRLALNVSSPNAPTPAVTLPAASSGTLIWRWLHGVDPWTESVGGSIEVRRTAGANNVEVGYPLGGFIVTGPDGCTTTGQ